MRGGCTEPHARKLLRIVYGLVRRQIEDGHFVMPGVLVVKKRHEDMRVGHCRYKATVVLDRRARQKRKIDEYRGRSA